jgi:hypothetical protein
MRYCYTYMSIMPIKSARKKFFWDSYSLRAATLASILVFVVFLSVFLWVTCRWTSYKADIAVRELDSGIALDKQYLTSQGDAIAVSPDFIEVAQGGDQDKIVSLLKKERDRRDIGLLGFANRDGFVISRTRTSSSTGENTLVVSPQGRAIAAGAERVASVEASSFDPAQLFITTGRHVYGDRGRVGTLFVNRLMDDVYADGFSQQYLPAGSEVLFYTREYGIYGSSISDSSLHKIVLSYFNTDSGWIRSARSGTMIRFDRDNYYQVRNVVFDGLEGNSPGGALVLVPYYGYSTVARAVFALIAGVIFALIVWKKRPSVRDRNRYYHGAIAVFGFLLSVVILTLSRSAFIPYSQLREIPYVLYNSTMRLLPEAGVFDTRFERPISILLDTGNEHINSVSVVLSFSPDIVDVVDVDTEDSICTKFVEKMVDKIRHQIRIVCGLPTPGFSGSSGQIATVVFMPLKKGTSELRFTDETMVLANDGLGTNVLRVATDGSYRFLEGVAENAELAVSELRNPMNYTPAVYSPTHPNSARWYPSRNARFFWTSRATTTDFMYSFDTATSSTLTGGTHVGELSVDIQAPSDGVFYFHVAPIIGGVIGPVRNYRVMIDSMPPSDVEIRSSTDRVKVGEIVRFEFDAEDDGSGLQGTMYIDIDDSGLFLPVGKQTYVPFTNPGSTPVHLRVYDKAGNYTQVEKSIEVSGKPAQWLMRLTQ